jgi:hypothetical protein
LFKDGLSSWYSEYIPGVEGEDSVELDLDIAFIREPEG